MPEDCWDHVSLLQDPQGTDHHPQAPPNAPEFLMHQQPYHHEVRKSFILINRVPQYQSASQVRKVADFTRVWMKRVDIVFRSNLGNFCKCNVVYIFLITASKVCCVKSVKCLKKKLITYSKQSKSLVYNFLQDKVMCGSIIVVSFPYKKTYTKV